VGAGGGATCGGGAQSSQWPGQVRATDPPHPVLPGRWNGVQFVSIAVWSSS
jgi:hypothetical protein